MSSVKVNIDVSGHWYNHWPLLQISLNGVTIFDDVIQGDRCIHLDLDCDHHNLLTFRHYGRRFGEDGIWDSAADGSGARVLVINDIRFDGISIDHLRSQLVFKTQWSTLQLQQETQEFIDQRSEFACNGMMSFNGTIDLEFNTPIYNWLTLNKYKVPMTESAYFSNYSARWHYEQDLKLINEIQELIDVKNRSS